MDQMSASLDALRARGRPIPMDAAARQAWARQFNALPAMGAMGASLDLSDETLVRVHLTEVRPHHQGGMGSAAVNGAVIAGLFDAALGVAGVIQFPGKLCAVATGIVSTARGVAED